MNGRLAALVTAWAVGVALTGGAIWLVSESNHSHDLAAFAVLLAVSALSFITSGLIAIWRRPENRTGLLLAATGYAWLTSALITANEPWVFTIGYIVSGAVWCAFAHLILAYPTGRLQTRFNRIYLAAVYALVLGEGLALMLVDGADEVCGPDCPESTIAVWRSDVAADALVGTFTAGTVLIIAVALWRLVRSYRAASPALRRALGGVLLTSGATLALVVVAAVADLFSSDWSRAFGYAALIAFGAVPIAFLLGLLRARLARSAAGQVLVQLGEGVGLRDALARALHDPTLEIGYWVPAQERYVDSDGKALPDVASNRALRLVERDGRPMAALLHDRTLLDEPDLVDAVAAAAALWLENERLRVETRAQYLFLETIVNTAPSLLVNVDTEGVIRNFNGAVERASGLDDPEGIRGRHFWDVFIGPAERDAMIARFRTAAPEFAAAEYENAFVNARGEELVIAWSTAPLVDEEGVTRGVIAGGLDVTERKRQELELLVKEERLRATIDASPVAIVELGPGNVICSWNPAAERMFGWTADEVLDRPVPIIPPGLGKGADAITSRVQAGEIVAGYETVRQRRDGTLVDVEVSAAPLRNEAGVVTGGMALYVDVTERKRRGLALQSSEERLRAMIQASPLAIVEIGLDDIVIAWNPAAERIFGWSAEEAIGRPMPFVPAGKEDEVAELVRRVNSGQSYTGLEAVRQRKDGSPIDVAISAAPVRDSSGAVVARMALFADITERKRRELELRVERDLASTLADTIPVLTAIVDEQASLTEHGVNPAFEHALGISEAEVAGTSLLELVEEGDRYLALMAIASAANGVPSAELESRWLGRDGSTRAVAWTARPIIGMEGRLVLVTGVDVTERKWQEEEVRASRSRIVEAQDEARRRLERDLHDGAQQRLVALSVALRLAEAKLDGDPKEARELLSGAREELGHAIHELRELARGIHPAVLTDRGLEAALEALAARAPLPIELSVPEERLPPPVEAAAYYLAAEALTNVTKYAGATAACIAVTRSDGALTVEIADDGVGGADPGRGTGLRGLADRVAALNGTLEVESPPGEGTRVRARIPVREPALQK